LLVGEYPEAGKLIETSDLSDQLKDKLLGQNCLDFLGLKKESFL
jgi:hypothetical protein